MQEIPMASFLLVRFEVELEKDLRRSHRDNSDFATWFRTQATEIPALIPAPSLEGLRPGVRATGTPGA
jgi:hypothetical protein